jgi:hypothetical protein
LLRITVAVPVSAATFPTGSPAGGEAAAEEGVAGEGGACACASARQPKTKTAKVSSLTTLAPDRLASEPLDERIMPPAFNVSNARGQKKSGNSSFADGLDFRQQWKW